MTKFQKAIIGILTVDVIAVFGCLALFVVTSGSGLNDQACTRRVGEDA